MWEERLLPLPYKGGRCENGGAGYLVRCETCLKAGKLSTYAGETGRNGFTRGEHLDALRLEDDENPLWKHCLVEHGGTKA